MNALLPYKEILRKIASEFITYPDCLEVNEFNPFSASVRLTIRGHLSDQPKLVGGQAKNIQSLNSIMSEIGNNRGQKLRVSLLDSTIGKKEEPTPFKTDEKWNRDQELQDLLTFVCSQAMATHFVVSVQSKPLVTVLKIESELPLNPEFEFALSTIFRAIGKNKGRIVNIHGAEENKESFRSKASQR